MCGVKVTDRRLRRLPCVLVVGVVGGRDALSPPVPEDTWVDRAMLPLPASDCRIVVVGRRWAA